MTDKTSLRQAVEPGSKPMKKSGISKGGVEMANQLIISSHPISYIGKYKYPSIGLIIKKLIL
jgi:hypothetical protein